MLWGSSHVLTLRMLTFTSASKWASILCRITVKWVSPTLLSLACHNFLGNRSTSIVDGQSSVVTMCLPQCHIRAALVSYLHNVCASIFQQKKWCLLESYLSRRCHCMSRFGTVPWGYWKVFWGLIEWAVANNVLVIWMCRNSTVANFDSFWAYIQK